MPNKASAKKALRQSEKRALQNEQTKRTYLYAVKQTRKAVEEGKKTDAQGWLAKAQKALAKAAQKGIIKPNTASRNTSRLHSAVNNLK